MLQTAELVPPMDKVDFLSNGFKHQGNINRGVAPTKNGNPLVRIISFMINKI